jgi:hypothetical protein
MAGFRTKLRVELESDDIGDEGLGNWQLIDPLVYDSDLLAGTITVPSGFVTDLASVPHEPFAAEFALGRADRAAVIHDYLISLGTHDWHTMAEVFREAMIVTGYSPATAQLFYGAVMLHGELSGKK